MAKSAVKFLDRKTPPHISTLIILSALPALSMTLFLPSLPNMTEYFQTDYRVMQLSVATYLFVNAVLQVVVGPISDFYGRRVIVLWGIVLFLIASLGCVLAPNVELFLFFRMSQAVIVTGMVLARAIVRDLFPANEAASMIGYVTMGMAVAPMLGPMIGGFLDEAFGWKASFSLFLLIGGMTLIISYYDLGETLPARKKNIWSQFREYPELFRSHRFWGYCFVAAFSSGVFFAYLGGAPFVGTEIFGLSPGILGFYFGLTAFGYMSGNFLSGRLSVRLGINKMIIIGCMITLIGPTGPILATYAGSTHPLSFFGFAVLMGIGNGFIMPNATAGMLSVRPHLAGTAAGIGGAIMIGIGSGLSALAGSLLTKESGPYPLYYIMLLCVILGLISGWYVVIRGRSNPSNQD
ncbi:MAG: multidrug effflux MFS transporter [Rhodobacteraceae bacterium]|nr:multidrug effflux MFS transporter [Paracoccaceae bacterium]MCY4250480.1 multidrug effflux MFS transporter [Paracoccaceae bacterium]